MKIYIEVCRYGRGIREAKGEFEHFLKEQKIRYCVTESGTVKVDTDDYTFNRLLRMYT